MNIILVLLSVSVMLAATANAAAPTADAGPDQTVTAFSAVNLDGTGSSDPDGDALTYAWSQTAGPAVTLSSLIAVTPSFTAPTGPASLTFQLQVCDANACDTDTVDISVLANQAPTADAGPDQTVTAFSSVNLDGTGSSDPDGDALTYAWSQTAGPAVTLSSLIAVTPSFTAPTGPASLTFQLQVCDANACDTDTVQVAVSASPPPAPAPLLSFLGIGIALILLFGVAARRFVRQRVVPCR